MARIAFILLFVLPALSVYADIRLTVDIQGIEDEQLSNARLFLSIDQQKDHELLSESRLRRLHNKAPDEIRRSLQAYGYYRPEIKSELKQTAADQWLASYRVDPGPAIPLGVFELNVSEPLRSDPAYIKNISYDILQIGAPFKHRHYEAFKSSLSQFASERGYFDATFVKHLVEIDLQHYEARIYLHYESGRRYNFGEINIDQTSLNDGLLQRYISFQQGEPYSQGKLIDLQQGLNDSDYFKRVEVSPGPINTQTGEAPVSIKLVQRKDHRFSFGLGYGSDTGARARFDWLMPLINPQGHRFNTSTVVSELGYNLGVQYRVPVLNPRTDQLVYNAGVVNEETDTSESTLQTTGVSLNHRRGQWREVISLNFQQEDFVVADLEDDSTLLIPGIAWSRIWGNNFIYAIDGVRFDLELRGANREFYSDTSFGQLRGSIKAISSFTQKTRLIARGTFGTTSTNEFSALPSSVRFFAGGAQSVRGFSYESLGPTDEDGDVIGGKHLLVGSLEVEHWVTEKWGLALFYDAGNAIDDFNDTLEEGAGIGYRWKSPIGSIRIDIANALSDEDKPWRLHINIGPDL